MITTTEPDRYPDADLQETTRTSEIARLRTEVTRLRRTLTRTLASLRNLIAAARATLGADADGEPDPLYYLRDELQAQGCLPPGTPNNPASPSGPADPDEPISPGGPGKQEGWR